MKTSPTPLVLITCGDPAGVGPELAARAVSLKAISDRAAVAFVGPESVWRVAFGLTGIEPPPTVPSPDTATNLAAGESCIIDVDIVSTPGFNAETDIQPGNETALGGEVAFASLARAVDLLQDNIGDALMTAPLSKHAVNERQPGFVGHTGYLGDRTRATPLMMLEGGGLSVALVTAHVPLKQVPDMITRTRVLDVLRRLHAGLTVDYRIAHPRIAVCGLNPHAGEGGVLGSEEDLEIIPAIAAARGEGIQCDGPFPGDTAPTMMLAGDADVILAMYHDQGLAPLKAVGFSEGVNVTLGLPIIRTSPDHGTAFSLAGTGKALVTPTVRALERAVAIWQNRRAVSP